MRCAVLLLPVVAALSACGESPSWVPGTIPPSLTFELQRVSDSDRQAIYGQLVETEQLEIGQPAPDFFDGRFAVWRFRTLFGDLIDEPGAEIEFQHGGTTISKADAWRANHGYEFCLLVGEGGTAMAESVRVEDPVERVVQSGWNTAVVRLRLDDSGLAAHRKLGVLRIQILEGTEVVDTLTEDDFDGFLERLKNESGVRVDSWSLRTVVEDYLIRRVVSVRGQDGSSASIEAEAWADASREPVLRFDGEGLTFFWTGPEPGQMGDALVRDVSALVVERARRP